MDVACGNHPVKIGGPKVAGAGTRIRKSCRIVKNSCISLPDLTIIRKQTAASNRVAADASRLRAVAQVSAAGKRRALSGRLRLSATTDSIHKCLGQNWLVVQGRFLIGVGKNTCRGAGYRRGAYYSLVIHQISRYCTVADDGRTWTERGTLRKALGRTPTGRGGRRRGAAPT
jgi:hypothetical protein